MKKIVLICLLIIVANGFVFADEAQELYTKLFLSRFQKCIPCKMQQIFSAKDGNIVIFRKLGNWQNHKCRYYEEITKNNRTEKFTCVFTREQVNILHSAMKNDPNGVGVAGVEWNKLKNNQDVCTFEN